MSTSAKKNPYSSINVQLPRGVGGKHVDNRQEQISSRLAVILSHIWELNEQEKSYLNKHFLLIRSLEELQANHVDNHQLGSTILNGGIRYQVVFSAVENWSAISPTDKIVCSFRFQLHSALAVVIVRRYREERTDRRVQE